MYELKFSRIVFRVDYIDHDGEKGYSYFVDCNPFNYDLVDVLNKASTKLRIPMSSFIGIRELSKLPSGVVYYNL